MLVVPGPEATVTSAPRNLRHNLLALGTDYAAFRVGQSFASATGFGLLRLTVLGRCVWDPRRIPLRETPSV